MGYYSVSSGSESFFIYVFFLVLNLKKDWPDRRELCLPSYCWKVQEPQQSLQSESEVPWWDLILYENKII